MSKFLDAVMARLNEEMMLSLRSLDEPRPRRAGSKPEKPKKKSYAKKWMTPPKFERRPYPGAGARAEKLRRKLGFNEFNRRMQHATNGR